MAYTELMTYLMQIAASLSGLSLPATEAWPPVTALPQAALVKEVCPDRPSDCTGLAAVYDTEKNRVLMLDSLNIENDTDNSFLVHEFTHFLQHSATGDAIFATCEATLATETQAYSVQNRYLRKTGQFARFGEALRFLDCGPDTEKPSVDRAL